MKVIIYPYDEKSLPVVMFEEMLKNMTIYGLVAPDGFGDQKEIKTSIGKRYRVSHDLNEEGISEVDGVLIVDSYLQPPFEVILEFVEKAVSNGLDIFCVRSISSDEKEKIISICQDGGVQFKELIGLMYGASMDRNMGLCELHTPIVAVAGSGERCNQTNIQLGLIRLLKEKGYKARAILSEDYDIFEDAYPFPRFMVDNELDERSKIINYNLFIKDIERRESPDVILISVPGELMPLTRHKTGNFGIKAYEIFNAVSPDFVVVSLYRDNYADAYFDEIDKLMSYRFNTHADCFFINCITLDRYTVSSDLPLKYLNEDAELVDRQCREYLHKVYSEKTMNEMAECMIGVLEGYAETEVI